MDDSVSYSRIENDILPKFRKQISEAESTEDLKNFFRYSVQELFRQIFAGKIEIGQEDVRLMPDNQPPFAISDQIQADEAFSSVWNNSDLSSIITRLSETATHRYLHLAKNLKKTEAKIRM
ncbi:hypothetical protein JWG42_05100 [Desulfoprunum benzoelyticum]|uniref:Uncharacterized protein n=1 Tax=Desulfoprunum benzoelyticum TaxID=1506996 RepID=A0A840V3F9_9BACT|nr:hypothetical protein [Desulfoprunum benzoelyticum]MBB5348279.1 hypothetical protein [Desulfoprunum benzoelyticum]MBM9529530.1 hypothetical protein [Desulfoprunum benzoelyticum]